MGTVAAAQPNGIIEVLSNTVNNKYSRIIKTPHKLWPSNHTQ